MNNPDLCVFFRLSIFREYRVIILSSSILIPVLVTALMVMQGCGLRHTPSPDMQARKLMTRVTEQNKAILTSRGMADVTLIHEGQTQYYRMAWIARYPHHLRMTLLTSGIPIETIASDGQKVTFVSHTGTHAPHTLNRTDPSLASLISLPVRPSHIIALVTGRIPAFPFTDGRKIQQDGFPALALTNRWGKTVQTLMFDNAHHVTELKRFLSAQEPEAIFRFSRYQDTEGFFVAKEITIIHQESQLLVNIVRFTPNIPLEKEDPRFQLTPQTR